MVSTQPVVLLAEDNDDDVIMLRRAIRQARIDTPLQVVSDGDEAIAYLRGVGKFSNRAEYPLPDLFLLDLKMPGRDGFEVLEWLRGEPSLSPLRTIVLTNSEDSFDVNRAYALGANSFLTKPLDLLDFGDTLGEMFRYWLQTARTPQVSRPGEQRSSRRPNDRG